MVQAVALKSSKTVTKCEIFSPQKCVSRIAAFVLQKNKTMPNKNQVQKTQPEYMSLKYYDFNDKRINCNTHYKLLYAMHKMQPSHL